MHPLVLIPARMASTRLPDKPLADIAGEPMIVHVWRCAVAAKLGRVAVACDGEAIARAIRQAGGQAVLTDPGLPSGSDRIYQALDHLDREKNHDVIINVQGDMPLLDPAIIISAAKLLENPEADIGTLAAPLREDEKDDPAVVKVVIASLHGGKGRALSFSRRYAPGSYHHIGIYVYRRAALERFVTLPPSPREKEEKLEQLRAMEAGMRIDAAVVKAAPLGVDTPEGLERARGLHKSMTG